MVCLEDRKAVPVAGRGRKREGKVRKRAPKDGTNTKKKSKLEEVTETEEEWIDYLIET